MYFDFIKNDYSDKPLAERAAYIERDKQALSSIILEKIAHNADEMVNRWYKLSDIGFLQQKEKFLDLLHEAEQLYCFGFYTGTIAIIGIACEEYCKYLMSDNGISDEKKQELRINRLYSEGIIEKGTKDALHTVRKVRNNCMHYNRSFKELSESQLEHSAFDMITHYKTCLAPLATKIDDLKDENIIESFVKSKEHSLREYLYKHRNILRQTKGVDLQISPDVDSMLFTSVYFIAEIDISEEFKEMTLIDLQRSSYPVVVDLTLPQCEMINSLKLREGNLITASIISAPSQIGQTEEWLLLKIDDISRIVFTLEELF